MLRKLTKSDLDEFVKKCKIDYGVTIRDKRDSRLMRFLGKLMFFNRDFTEHYVTTIGRTIYWPNFVRDFDKDVERSFRIFFHEMQHVVDYSSMRYSFCLSYLFPQLQGLVLFVLSLVMAAIFKVPSPYWTLSFFWLLLLLPMPSYPRMMLEMSGYSCDMAFKIWYENDFKARDYNLIVKQFTGSHYYFMWPFREAVLQRLANIDRNVRSGNVTGFKKKVYLYLKDRGIV